MCAAEQTKAHTSVKNGGGGKGMIFAMAKSIKTSVVNRAIDIAGEGSVSEFARRLSRYAGFEVSRQAVNNWKKRGYFSRNILTAVHSLTNLSMDELLETPLIRNKRGGAGPS